MADPLPSGELPKTPDVPLRKRIVSRRVNPQPPVPPKEESGAPIAVVRQELTEQANAGSNVEVSTPLRTAREIAMNELAERAGQRAADVQARDEEVRREIREGQGSTDRSQNPATGGEEREVVKSIDKGEHKKLVVVTPRSPQPTPSELLETLLQDLQPVEPALTDIRQEIIAEVGQNKGLDALGTGVNDDAFSRAFAGGEKDRLRPVEDSAMLPGRAQETSGPIVSAEIKAEREQARDYARRRGRFRPVSDTVAEAGQDKGLDASRPAVVKEERLTPQRRLISQGGRAPLPRGEQTDFEEMERKAEEHVASQREQKKAEEARAERRKANREALQEALVVTGIKHTNRLEHEVDAQNTERTLVRPLLRGPRAEWQIEQGGRQYDARVNVDRKRTMQGGDDFTLRDASVKLHVGKADVQFEKLKESGDVPEIPTRVRLDFGGHFAPGRIDEISDIVGRESPLVRLLRSNGITKYGFYEYEAITLSIDPNNPDRPPALSLTERAVTVFRSQYDPDANAFNLIHAGGDYKGQSRRHSHDFTGEEFAQLYDNMLSLIPDNPNHRG